MTQLLTSQAFPSLYKWTTYPLTSLLDAIFKQRRAVFETNKFDHTLLVEFCSVVERAVNFMHTGNTAVIATTVMNPLWIGRALVKDGFPSINSDIVDISQKDYRIKIDGQKWPFDKTRHQPHSSSRRSHLLTYGESHFNVSIACFLFLCDP